MKNIYITNYELNNFTEEQLSRLVFIYYDGQGDTSCLLWKDFIKISEEWKVESGVESPKNSDKFDLFYNDCGLNWNISEFLYFDFDNEYKRINFKE